ncbi:hypothetical protein [Actinophytocola oryzae]|uniref:Uncharacterized protein n=1 Tax=Actinophytocola oryzae TaxID=502181 RepID=A0A4R7W3A9_9PSEU|nr:hypothetical protein [Actinophytocola oryzae]TDV56389.1 hypothetical protein CLV71_102456 [Actinophytocola oryzae]
MYFRITGDSVDLVDPQDVTAFHVLCPPGLDGDELAGRLRDAGLGELLADGHVMVPVDAVRRHAAGRVGPTWEQDLAGMIAYATREGWTDETGTRLRAHLERATD